MSKKIDGMYVVIKDSNGNHNIWEIVCEYKVFSDNHYLIKSRTSSSYIEKEYCFVRNGSSLLYYENPERRIDIEDSEIDLDRNEQYKNIYLCSQCIFSDVCSDTHNGKRCPHFYDLDDSALEIEVLTYQFILSEYNVEVLNRNEICHC